MIDDSSGSASQSSEESSNEFATLLRGFCTRSRLALVDLAEYSGIPFYTIRNWGRAQARPRDWQDLLKVGLVLDLTAAELDELLRKADHPPLDLLRDRYPNHALWQHWPGEAAKPESEVKPPPGSDHLLTSSQPLSARLPTHPPLRHRIMHHWPTLLLITVVALASSGLTYWLVPQPLAVEQQFPPPPFNASRWRLIETEMAKKIDMSPSYIGPQGVTYVKAGERVRFSFRIINSGDVAAIMPVLDMAIRGPDGCKNWQGQIVETQKVNGIAAMPNEGYTHREEVVFTKPGIYFVEPLNTDEHRSRWNWFKVRRWFVVAAADGSLPDLQCLRSGTPTTAPS